MRVLVTGGAGYIGSATVRELLAGGHEPIVLDDLSTGHRRAVPAGVRLEQATVEDTERLGRILREHAIGAVIHFAARSLVGESVAQPLDYYAANVGGALSLLTACGQAGVERLVFSSSAGVYGTPTSVPIDEAAPLAPISPYGRTKQMIESILEDVCHASSLTAVSLRYFNAAGALPGGEVGEDHSPETHLIPNLLAAARDGRETPFTIHGDDYPTADGTCVRDYIHVGDLARAHRLALEATTAGHRAYNLGSGAGVSVGQMLSAAREITGAPIAAVVGPRRPGDPPELVASIERARTELGFEPAESSLQRILQTAWDWHRSHPRGFGDA